MGKISDKEFVDEMIIFYQNCNQTRREIFSDLIRIYFNHGNRAEKIIDKLKN